MKILLISNYPHDNDKSQAVFVYRLMESLSEKGCEIVVISPQNWRTKVKRTIELPGTKSYGRELATVYRPKYFDFPNRIRIGGYSLGRLNALQYKNAVKRVLKNLEFTPDLVYSHFLYRSGPASIFAANLFKVPAVLAVGESSLEKYVNIFGKDNMSRLINQFAGIISVSNKNSKYCVSELSVSEERISIFPNGVNTRIFYPRDKSSMRKKYNLPEDKFIVAFTGHFIERKGPLRVLEALNRCDVNFGGIFIGSGVQEPIGDKVLFSGRLTHLELPEMLSAADVFVLPTQNEGSCNAIVEAIACGLPIISSDIEAIREQVDSNIGILVEPNDVDAIHQAIIEMYNNSEKRKSLRINGLKLAEGLTLENRACSIKSFISKFLK